jgi:hypothetical protein
MQNNLDHDMLIGATKNDEMCNFYIMYSMPNTAESEAEMQQLGDCYGEGFSYTRSEWRREFGVSSGFPRDSTVIPAADVEMAKTMGDHMNMNMGATQTQTQVNDNADEMDEMENDMNARDDALENEIYQALLSRGRQDDAKRAYSYVYDDDE